MNEHESKICYILLTHYVNESIANKFNKIRNDISQYKNIYPFLLIVGLDVNYKDLKNKYNLFCWGQEEKIYVGNSIFPIIDFREKTSFDYYIVQEYDCEFTGKYNEVIQIILENKFDVWFQSHLEPQQNWYWKKFNQIPTSNIEMKKCFLQWYCLSSNALDYIKTCYENGWNGHYESILPTAILNSNIFSIGYLEDYFETLMSDNKKDFEIILNTYLLNNTNYYKDYDPHGHNSIEIKIRYLYKLYNKGIFIHPIKL